MKILTEKIYISSAPHSRARTLAAYLTELYPNISIEAFLANNTEENATEDIVGMVHYRRHFILPRDWQLLMNKHDIV